MKKKTKNYYSIFLIAIYILCVFIFIHNVFIKNNKLTHIEKVIKKHNSINKSIANPKYQIIEKPASSQSTVIYGDSVRVYKNIENK
jgi:hypothetical protein